jgi:hypothetical protein
MPLPHDTEDASHVGQFGPEPFPWLFHSGANISFKTAPVRRGESAGDLSRNYSLSSRKSAWSRSMLSRIWTITGSDAAHTFLEVIPNKAHQTLTEPEQVYVLHWIDLKLVRLDFAPPYVIDNG